MSKLDLDLDFSSFGEQLLAVDLRVALVFLIPAFASWAMPQLGRVLFFTALQWLFLLSVLVLTGLEGFKEYYIFFTCSFMLSTYWNFKKGKRDVSVEVLALLALIAFFNLGRSAFREMDSLLISQDLQQPYEGEFQLAVNNLSLDSGSITLHCVMPSGEAAQVQVPQSERFFSVSLELAQKLSGHEACVVGLRAGREELSSRAELGGSGAERPWLLSRVSELRIIE